MSDDYLRNMFGKETTTGTPAREWVYVSPHHNQVLCAVCRMPFEQVGFSIEVRADRTYHYILGCGHDEGVVTLIPNPDTESE